MKIRKTQPMKNLHLPHDILLHRRVAQLLHVVVADGCVVDQNIESLALQLLLDFGSRFLDGFLVGDIKLDKLDTGVVLGKLLQGSDVVASAGKDLADFRGLARSELLDEGKSKAS